MPAKKMTKKKVAKVVAKKAPAKKVAAKRPPTKKKTVARSKKVTAPPSGRKKVKGTPKPKASKKAPVEYWDVNEHGIRVGSDLATILDTMIEGGFDRRDVVRKALDKVGSETKTGKPKNVSSSITMLLVELEKKGYQVESHWRLIPPAKRQKVKKS